MTDASIADNSRVRRYYKFWQYLNILNLSVLRQYDMTAENDRST
jgi:hypothetical protein